MKPKTTSDWKQWHKEFREFLSSIPMDKYRELREIKTVEQDLPKELNPLPWIYKFYYPEEEKPTFPEFEEFFEKYWQSNLVHIEKFIRKYFYGCSLQFVYEGFKARLWRTWISLLTQFDFAYLWNDLFGTNTFLEASAELDMQGLDGLIHFSLERRIGIQIKKISYRREASQRRFA
ncbi:MAG: TaqI family restriction endonuclease, partial [Chlorobi bacterium]|nr:TaqI family restriction endonuclease [Chlorobiota bacterium]